jgi:hypothetical protein
MDCKEFRLICGMDMISNTPSELPAEKDGSVPSGPPGVKAAFWHRKLKTVKEYVEPWSFVVGLTIGVGLGISGMVAWIRTSAQSAVMDEKFLGTLAAHVRPTCIFDSHGTIEADLGAGEYIEDIRVTPTPENYGFEVVIRAKRHLAYAPLVTGVDANLFPDSATRGKLHDWKIVLAPNTTLDGFPIGGGPGMDTNKLHRFKVEILH